MIILLPDGNTVNTVEGFRPVMAFTDNNLIFLDAAGNASTLNYFCVSIPELVDFYNQITNGLASGLQSLQLVSSAIQPTNGNAAATDMFFDANVAVPNVPVAGYKSISLTIGTDGTTPAWPAGGAGYGTPGIPACFKPEATVNIGGVPVAGVQYVNGATLLLRLSPMPAGTYALDYKDNRGTVTKAGAITYV